MSKKDKLVMLKKFANLETGTLDASCFDYEDSLYKKSIRKKSLDSQIRDCRLCSGLNIKRYTECAVGWGDLDAAIFFIGQSLHEPGVLSGIPFILGSGYSIDAALRLSGLRRKDVFMSNTIHCHPPNNRTSTEEEKKNCLAYLKQEIDIVQPKLLVALGNDAHAAVEVLKPEDTKVLKVKHPAAFFYSAPEMRIEWIVKMSLEMDKYV